MEKLDSKRMKVYESEFQVLQLRFFSETIKLSLKSNLTIVNERHQSGYLNMYHFLFF